MKRICVDVGGTFTDCLVLDVATGRFQAFKTPSTPSDPSVGFVNALEQAAAFYAEPLESLLREVELLIHGTTLATNTLLTGTGARTGMITSRGFRDSIEMRRGRRDPRNSMYNLFIPPYEPIVPRARRLGVPERLDATGKVVEALDEGEVRRAVDSLRNEGVESVAVCFLYSYMDPEHEQRAAQLIEGALEGVPVTTSSGVLPVWREFERFSTTVVSAYLEPKVAAYLQGLEARLHSHGFAGRLLMVLANGLMQTVSQCLGRAVYLLNSGPAAAPSGASYLGQHVDGGNLLSVDMGGTSFDVCLIPGREIPTSSDAWVGDHRVAIKMVDVRSVGAGGGSVAWIDSLGLLRVGPQSSGSDPGPACFGEGVDPTVTDADLLLGYIPADYFLGGKVTLSAERAREAVARVAGPLGMSELDAAHAIFRTANANMADLIAEVCTRRGFDVRDFTMVAGGGAGPVHAAFIAELEGVEKVLVPSFAALLSAFGMFTMDIGRDFARSYFAAAGEVRPERVNALFGEMEQEARAAFASMGLPADQIRWTRTAELRYRGQFHEVEIPIPAGAITEKALEDAVGSFHQRHGEIYAFSMPWLPVEFLTFRLLATAPPMSFELPSEPSRASAPKPERSRLCRFGDRRLEAPIYRGAELRPGDEIGGPAVLEEALTTVVVPEGWRARVDERHNYALQRLAR